MSGARARRLPGCITVTPLSLTPCRGEEGGSWKKGKALEGWAPGAPHNPAAHSQYKALQQNGRRSAPCCLKPERPNEDGQGQLGVGVRGTWHNTAQG